eukprot:14247773-Alexandrium_andersonii.AAC.1
MRRIPSEAPGHAATPYGSNEGVLHAGSPSGEFGGNAASPATSPSGGDGGELRACSPSPAQVPTAARSGDQE